MEDLEEVLTKNNDEDNLNFLFVNNLIKKEYKCEKCSDFMKLTKSPAFVDRYAWRCYKPKCSNYKKRFSIRKDSFFEGLRVDIKTVFRVLIRWASDQQQYSILKAIQLSTKSYKKIIDRLLNLIRRYNELNIRKMGGPGNLVQLDETMMISRCRRDRPRKQTNRMNIITIIEYRDGIAWVHGEIINDREKSTVLPIICRNVISGSKIHTDDYAYYSTLSQSGFCYESARYNYEFISKKTGTHIEEIELFHSYLKQEIKKRKGIRREDRNIFLVEFLWKFNNRETRFESLFDLIRI